MGLLDIKRADYDNILMRIGRLETENKELRDSQESVKWTLNSARKSIGRLEEFYKGTCYGEYPTIKDMMDRISRLEENVNHWYGRYKEPSKPTECKQCGTAYMKDCCCDEPLPSKAYSGLCSKCKQPLNLCECKPEKAECEHRWVKSIVSGLEVRTCYKCYKCEIPQTDTIRISRKVAEEWLRSSVMFKHFSKHQDLRDAIRNALEADRKG